MNSRTKEIIDILDKTYPNAKCALNYNSAFELLIATILSAQCTDERVNIVTSNLFSKYNTPSEIYNLNVENLINYIKSCGLGSSKANNIIKTCKILIEEYNSNVPNNMEDLIKLPGVGRKTANVLLSNVFDVPAIAVDTHVGRVANRLSLTKNTDPNKIEQDLMKKIDENLWSKSHHLLIFHGRNICKSVKPLCGDCPLNHLCKYNNNLS